MRIVCISDTHNHTDGIKMPEGDMLIHAGDAGMSGKESEFYAFNKWLSSLDYKYKLFVPGNHDGFFERSYQHAVNVLSAATVLVDKEIIIEGVKFYGTPWQPAFNNWAFNLPRGSAELEAKWLQIPLDTDVLISHCPPKGILDLDIEDGVHKGCSMLFDRVLREVQPKYHIFGHIHYYGQAHHQGVHFVNPSAWPLGEFTSPRAPIILEI